MQETSFLVGFIGQPSVGKSTIINSLIGKRILHSGICRTTQNVHFIGCENKFNFPEDRFHPENPVSDDQIPFSILDLPGISDAEDVPSSAIPLPESTVLSPEPTTNQNFDELTRRWIIECDLIFWVTDISTAFLTSHEKNEFLKIQSLLAETSKITAKLYQLGIVLSKYDFDSNENSDSSDYETEEVNSPLSAKQTGIFSVVQLGRSLFQSKEITTKHEDTTISDCFSRVYKMNFGVPLIKFNAFGRILHPPEKFIISKALKDLLHKKSASSANRIFCLTPFVTDFPAKKESVAVTSLLEYHFAQIVQDKLTITSPVHKIVELLQSITSLENRFQIFQFLMINSQAKLSDLHPFLTYSWDADSWLYLAEAVGLQSDFGKIFAEKREIFLGGSSSSTAERSARNLHKLNLLCGPNNLEVVRFHIRLLTEHTRLDLGTSRYPNFTYFACRNSSSFQPKFHPEIFRGEIELYENPRVICSTEFIEKVRNARERIWGTENERGVDIRQLLNFLVFARQLISSPSSAELKKLELSLFAQTVF